jgi:uncharacterized repeat protein (TIGR01451 family)
MKRSRKHFAALAFIALAAARCGGTDRPGLATQGAGLATSTGPLTVTMGPAAPLVQGSTAAYTIALTNTTASPMLQISVSADFFGAQVNGLPAACVKLGGGQPLIGCLVASIAPGETVPLTFQIRPQLAGTLTFSAGIAANGAGVIALDDLEQVAPAATDVQVTGSSNNGSPPLGSIFTYTFQVKNNGPSATFGGVSFTDVLPASLGFVTVTTTLGACTGGATVSCALGDLPVGVQAVIQISARAPLTAQTIVDTASAAIGAQPDSNLNNNTVSVTVTPK